MKFVSNRQEEKWHNCLKNGIKNGRFLCFLQYVCVVVVGGNEGQLAVVGEEEEVHSIPDFCNRGQWGGWGGSYIS